MSEDLVLKCGKCKEFKESSFFGVNLSSKSGFSNYCKVCATNNTKKHQAQNRAMNLAKMEKSKGTEVNEDK